MRKDVIRLFPGVQDHTIVEILDTGASLDDLEAVVLELSDQDEALIESGRSATGRVSRVLGILALAGYVPEEDRSR